MGVCAKGILRWGADWDGGVGRGGCNLKGSGESPHSIWILLVNCEASRSYGDGEQGEAIRGLNETKNSMGIFVDWA
jgi:hypothetical protein